MFEFTFNGVQCKASEGDTIAAALLRDEQRHLRNSPKKGLPRGMFCAMGVCQECVVYANGKVRTACNTEALPGMEVASRTATEKEKK